MPLTTVYTHALLRAANALGSSTELARRLGVSRDVIRSWMRGADRPPVSVFLRAVDIIEANARKQSPAAQKDPVEH